jgi:sialate O-acetylesterase
VLVGEVWVCSGQSNMGYAMDTYKRADPSAFTEAMPHIRSCTVPYRGASRPQTDFILSADANAIQWVACDLERIRYLSATAFYFGRELHRHLKVPVGLVVAALGGATVESWAPRSAFESVPFNYRTPTTLCNAMIAPLTSLTIRGVIWYQGEGGTVRFKWDIFRKVTSAMISAWRKDWGLGDPSTGSGQAFPFLMVQLPYYTAVNPDPNAEHAFASCREEQRRAAAANPNAVAVVTFDTGHDTDIHPASKDVVGARLALAARALAYGEIIVHLGPVAKAVELMEGKVRVRDFQPGKGSLWLGQPSGLQPLQPRRTTGCTVRDEN